MSVQQGKRQAFFRAISSTTTDYNGDFLAAAATESFTGEFNGVFIRWLQNRTGSSSTNLDGLKQEFAELAGAHNWESMGGVPIIFEGCTLWIDTSDIGSLTKDGSNLLSTWGDKSSNGNDPTASGGDRPTFQTNQQNGLPAINYDGSDQMALPSGLFSIPNGNSTMFVVCKRATESGASETIINLSDGAAADYFLIYSATTGTLTFKSRDGAGGSLSSGGHTLTSYNIITTSREGATQTLSVNGSPEATNESGVSSAGIDSGDLGASNADNLLLTGDIAELIIFDRKLSSTEEFAELELLSSKWGIPLVAQDPFTLIVDSTLAGSASGTFIVPTTSGGSYDCDVWVDGSFRFHADTFDDANWSITGLSTASEISIVGEFTGFQFNDTGDKLKLTDITHYGCLKLGDTGGYFYGCANLTSITAPDQLDLTGTTTFFNAFRGCTNLTDIVGLPLWDTSGITTFRQMFQACASFNQSVSSFDTSSNTSLNSTFDGCTVFNQSVANFDTSLTINMFSTFKDCLAFNQSVANFDTSQVTALGAFVRGCTVFDQDISGFNVELCKNFVNMMEGSGFTQTNYDLMLVAWNAQDLQPNEAFHAGTAQYGAGAPASARANMVLATGSGGDGWTIQDGGAA